MSSPKPTRQQADLAEVLEMVLDKGIVINADIAITVGDTEMIGIELRAAIASFDTAARYGLAFPSGTDMRRVEQASGRKPLEADGEPIDLGIEASSGGAEADARSEHPPNEEAAPEPPDEGDRPGEDHHDVDEAAGDEPEPADTDAGEGAPAAQTDGERDDRSEVG